MPVLNSFLLYLVSIISLQEFEKAHCSQGYYYWHLVITGVSLLSTGFVKEKVNDSHKTKTKFSGGTIALKLPLMCLQSSVLGLQQGKADTLLDELLCLSDPRYIILFHFTAILRKGLKTYFGWHSQ